MDIEIANVDKLKVAELRALLSSHELDTKGTKPILVARLTSYLESLPPKDPNAPVVEVAPVAATEGMIWLIILGLKLLDIYIMGLVGCWVECQYFEKGSFTNYVDKMR